MQIDWTINVASIITLMVLGGGVIGTWAVMGHRLGRLEKDLAAECEAREEAIAEESRTRKVEDDRHGTQQAALSGQIVMLTSQLHEHKLHVAETYITKAGLREFRDEVMTGVRDLKGSVSTLHERMDRFIEGDKMARPRRAPT